MPDGSVPSALPADCWRQIFGNQRAVAVEIGPGRGEFLCASARANPDRNYFAIEHSHGSTQRIADALRDERLSNARVLCGDATCLIELLPAASVAAFHILFPDPWWKRRHKKRLLITPRFVAALGRALSAGGTVEVVTDVAEYFTLAQKILDAEAQLAALSRGATTEGRTTFARKALQRGITLQRSVHQRV